MRHEAGHHGEPMSLPAQVAQPDQAVPLDIEILVAPDRLAGGDEAERRVGAMEKRRDKQTEHGWRKDKEEMMMCDSLV